MPIHLLELILKVKGNCNIMKSDNHMISLIISQVIDLSQLRRFDIIIYLKVDLFLINCYLIYLIFSSIYIKLAALMASDILPPQIYICKKVYFYLLRCI